METRCQFYTILTSQDSRLKSYEMKTCGFTEGDTSETLLHSMEYLLRQEVIIAKSGNKTKCMSMYYLSKNFLRNNPRLRNFRAVRLKTNFFVNYLSVAVDINLCNV